MITKFTNSDEVGMNFDVKVPCLAIELSKEELELIDFKVPLIFQADKISLFKIKNSDGTLKDSQMMYVIFN